MNLFSLFKKKPSVIVVLGQTATGKSALAVEIAKIYDGEIISADSRQVYRGLDIGTAKITNEEMQGIPHHMIDVADPNEQFSVQEYVHQAEEKIKDILQRKKVPIICGGTGMYIDALVFGQSFPTVPPNKKLRAELERLSTETLYKKLRGQDAQKAQSIDRYNRVRLIRALEIVAVLGKVPKQKQKNNYRLLFIGLELEKEEQYHNIEQRIHQRLETGGMIDEVQNLHKQGLSYERMEELGLEYRCIAQYLQRQLSYDEMVTKLITETKKFAKRQMTWFQRNKKIQWFHPKKHFEKIKGQIQKFLK